MPFKNITGQKFNHLTAVQRVGKDHRGESIWRCLCDCGKETVVLGGNLRSGHIKSCGCRPDFGYQLAGQRLHMLTVLTKVPAGEKQNRRDNSAQWLCRCDCGRTVVRTAGCLLTEAKHNCGMCNFGHYEFIDDYVIGHLADGKTTFKVDNVDFDQVSQHRWCKDTHGYIVTSPRKTNFHFLHQLILPPKEGYECDHINHDRTDNRRSNLRYATRSENGSNIGLRINNTSGYIGVSWHKNDHEYRALVEHMGKNINIGGYKNARDAAVARDRVAKRIFGEYAVLNFPEIEAVNG